MEKDENNAAAAQAEVKDNFAAFDGVSKELDKNSETFKSVAEMPKTNDEKGFDKLDKEINGEKAPEKKEEKKDPEAKAEGSEKDTKEVVAKDEKSKEAEKAPEENKELTDEDKATELEFDVTKLNLEKVPGEEEENSWATVAKDLGIEVKEDSFDSFKASVEERIAKAVEEGKTQAAKIELEKFTPEAQKVVEFLNANPGAKIDDFIAPLKAFDEVLALDNESILAQDLELKGLSAEEVQTKIEAWKDANMLDVEAKLLKNEILAVRANTEQQLIADAKAQQVYRYQQDQAAIKQENESIINAIKEVKTFMGFKIPESAKQYIQKQWESGEVRKAFQSNPGEVVQFMLNKYIGQEALKELKKTQFQKGRDEIQSKLHNTKELSSSEASGRREKTVSKTQVGAGGFDAWDNIESDKPSVDSNGY